MNDDGFQNEILTKVNKFSNELQIYVFLINDTCSINLVVKGYMPYINIFKNATSAMSQWVSYADIAVLNL